MSSTSSPPPSRLSLLDLPPEIKIKIVQLARARDLAYCYRVGGSDEEGWRGRGTSALFLTNRELSELAAVHLFKEVRSSRVQARTFVLGAADARPALHPRYTRTWTQSQLFRQPHSFPPRQLRRRLPFLPNLATLSLGSTEALHLLPKANVPLSESDEYTLIASAAAAKRVRHLVFRAIHISTDLPQFGTTLQHFPNLRCLSLLDLHSGDGSTEFIKIAAALPLLEELSVERYASTATIDWGSCDWTTTTLRRLRLISPLPFEDLILLNTFSSTLESVFVGFYKDADEDEDDLPVSFTMLAPTTFPRLRTLDLKGVAATLVQFLSLPSLATSPLQQIRLRITETCTMDASMPVQLKPFLAALSKLPSTLRRISVIDDDMDLSLPTLNRVVKRFGTERGITIVEGTMDAFDRAKYFYGSLDAEHKPEGTDDSLEELSDAVDSVLSFTRRTMDAIRAGRDSDGVPRLVAALEGLVEMKMLEDD